MVGYISFWGPGISIIAQGENLSHLPDSFVLRCFFLPFFTHITYITHITRNPNAVWYTHICIVYAGICLRFGWWGWHWTSPHFLCPLFLLYILTCGMLWNILVLIIYGKSAVNTPTLTGILVGCSRCHFLDIAKENGNGVIWKFIFDISTVHFSYFW